MTRILTKEDGSQIQASGTWLKSRLLKLLDRYAADLRSTDVPPSKPIVTPIARSLGEYRSVVSRDEWRDCIRRELRPHPILAQLHEDPYSSYGFRKPRGYAGDAVLLDFIYGGGANTRLVEGASRNELGAFDFIYSAGLYDYLSDDVAKRLTANLAGMLNPRGRLLIANMLPELPAAAYMEAVMDWWLVYRTPLQVKNLADSLGGAYRVATFERPFISYMEIENRASQ